MASSRRTNPSEPGNFGIRGRIKHDRLLAVKGEAVCATFVAGPDLLDPRIVLGLPIASRSRDDRCASEPEAVSGRTTSGPLGNPAGSGADYERIGDEPHQGRGPSAREGAAVV